MQFPRTAYPNIIQPPFPQNAARTFTKPFFSAIRINIDCIDSWNLLIVQVVFGNISAVMQRKYPQAANTAVHKEREGCRIIQFFYNGAR